ncbi:hypothetical protein GCM10023075_46150 [Streptosporangium album]
MSPSSAIVVNPMPDSRARRPKGVFSRDMKTWVSWAEEYEEWLPGDPRLPKHTNDGKPRPREAGAVCVRGLFNLEGRGWSPGVQEYRVLRRKLRMRMVDRLLGVRLFDTGWAPRPPQPPHPGLSCVRLAAKRATFLSIRPPPAKPGYAS